MRRLALYQTARQVITAKRNHATRRAKERHGLDLSRDDFDDMVREIQTGRAAILEKQSNTRSVFLVSAPKHSKLAVVYDRKRKVIVTVLPAGSREIQRHAHQIPGWGQS